MKTEPSSALSDFARLAAAFCAWCESGALGATPERIISRWLAQLYAACLLLAEVEAEEQAPEIPASDTSAGETAIRPLLGYYYREIFDPHPNFNEEPCVGDVGDDLLDVYRDIKRGMKLYELGFPRAAEWEWAFSFRVHWGRHATGALAALHGLVHSNLAGENAA